MLWSIGPLILEALVSRMAVTTSAMTTAVPMFKLATPSRCIIYRSFVCIFPSWSFLRVYHTLIHHLMCRPLWKGPGVFLALSQFSQHFHNLRVCQPWLLLGQECLMSLLRLHCLSGARVAGIHPHCQWCLDIQLRVPIIRLLQGLFEWHPSCGRCRLQWGLMAGMGLIPAMPAQFNSNCLPTLTPAVTRESLLH